MEYLLPENGDHIFEQSGEEQDLLEVDPLGYTLHTEKLSTIFRWELYYSGYKHAADLLIDKAPEEFSPDELLYPIVALYRHFVEMRLKGLLARISELGEDTINLESLGKHNIGTYWDDLKIHFHHFKPPLPPDQVETVEKCIHEFSKLDPESQSSRYPWDKKGTTSFSDLQAVNIKHLKITIEKLDNFFDIIGIAIDLEQEWRQEQTSL